MAAITVRHPPGFHLNLSIDLSLFCRLCEFDDVLALPGDLRLRATRPSIDDVVRLMTWRCLLTAASGCALAFEKEQRQRESAG
jgi:hypothetical protein